MSIDPSKISIDDLDRYERMMQGDGASGISNSLVSIRNDVKHTWQAWEEKPQVGPMDVKLSQPTNLIQMNIDVTFKCNAISELVQ